ncbi:GNAT family N-acetyltransferase [Desnuesiella massiliensis]|uniref:GNAT family N-acetyltransferase n=1 Tax=Desnuesiella massiliensis TaxID=1650662 RepID=UPI0006E145CA|nr:GNAT family N-acetyltransferase [Desnuesiella massiliensis]
MKIKIIHDASIVYEFLKSKSRYNYIYQFSNLSPRYWENVVCYGLFDNNEIKEIAMLNINYDIPVLLAASFDHTEYSIELIKRIKKLLPATFYSHINRETLEEVFTQSSISELEEYMNMGLCDYSLINKKYDDHIERLSFKNIKAIKELISISYPEAWLDDELVKLNENFGIYVDEKLVSFAGIHAYSEDYGVAAIAHVTTHPNYRRSGHAEKVIAALANSLKEKVDFIGLNVKVDNLQAINCYKKLGFSEFGKFVACVIENRG